MRIYVASSWRNIDQPNVVTHLKNRGHKVYDFRKPGPDDRDTGFSWRQVVKDEADLHNPRKYRDQVLEHPLAKVGFAKDMTALMGCDVCVLVLPCGRSAHLELGYAVGADKKTYVLVPDWLDEPELMYRMVTRVVLSLDELDEHLEKERERFSREGAAAFAR